MSIALWPSSYLGELYLTHCQSQNPRMGAWESEGMVRRNAHLALAHLREHAEVVSGLLNGTNTAQSGNEKGPALS